jgi:peptidoglycan/LPS O-acetylase OafA/YrhL
LVEQTSAVSAYQKRNNFNLIRLLGAFGVLFFHVYPLTGRENDPLSFTHWINFGSLSVRVFFVVSGFLLTDSYLRNPDIRSWAIARILRIWPALIGCTLFCVFVLGPMITIDPHYWRSDSPYSFLRNALIFDTQALLSGVFTANPIPVVNGSLWTLPYESFWYMALAASFVLFRDLRIGLGLVFLLCCWIILSGNGIQSPIFANVLVLFVCELGPFFLGGALIRLLKIRGSVATDIAMCLLLAYSVYISEADWRPFYEAQVVALPYLVIRIAYAPIRPLHSFLESADISYGVYLYAFPMTQTVVSLIGKDHSVFVTTIAALAATLPLACLSWIFVERPALSLRHMLRGSTNCRRPIEADRAGSRTEDKRVIASIVST